MTHASLAHIANKSTPVIEVRITANVSSVNIVLRSFQRVPDPGKKEKKKETPYDSKFLYEKWDMTYVHLSVWSLPDPF